MDEARIMNGVKRVLDVFAKPRARERHGLLQHEFAHAFSSDGWSMADFKVATRYAYDAGWIALSAHLYCLTETGKRAFFEIRSQTEGSFQSAPSFDARSTE